MQTPDAPKQEHPGAAQANIVSRAVRGAFWTILSGTGARVIGILGTLAVTHYLSPEEYGEVSLAGLLTLTATVFANAGVSQYLASKPHADRAAIFHATFYYMLLGVVALGLTLVFATPFSWLISAPGIGKYLPLLVTATLIERVCVIQDRIQVRDMRFRSIGIIRSIGELTYSGTSVGLAATCAGTMFGGGNALVWATMARALVRLVILSSTTPWRSWAEPHRITMAGTREFFSFGLPMSLATISGFGGGKFDNFVYSHHFGEAAVGKYNLAYNFADLPTVLITETVGDVLVPSFAHMENDERRRSSFLLALRTLVLLVTPAALGLSAVAPDLVGLAFPRQYEGITQTLRILVMFAVPRTIIGTACSYLQVRNRPRLIMVMEMLRMFAIVVVMHSVTLVTRNLFGASAAVHAACASVVMVFTLSALAYMLVIRKLDGVPLADQILPLLPPTLASVPMLLAVYGVRLGLDRIPDFATTNPSFGFGQRALVFGPRLVIEIVVGAAVFVPSALVLARTTSRELVRMVADSRKRRHAGPEPTADRDSAA